jgi:hypothetical protein
MIITWQVTTFDKYQKPKRPKVQFSDEKQDNRPWYGYLFLRLASGTYAIIRFRLFTCENLDFDNEDIGIYTSLLSPLRFDNMDMNPLWSVRSQRKWF